MKNKLESRDRLVLKFGGTSVMTPERIKNVARIIANAAAVAQVVVVVSAMGHATDDLIKLSSEITSMPDRRELDALMATGEQVSASLLSMALHSMGIKARSFSGAQAGICTDTRYGDAKIGRIEIAALSSCLDSGYIPVITGFQGISACGDTTTLGRGGSDTTAIAIAAALKAQRCDIYTDVDGIYSADPRIVEKAVKLDQISFSEMLELAENGAQVLNARSVEVARDKQVTVLVRSTFKPSDIGTLVNAEEHANRAFTSLALNNALNCIAIDLERLELGPDRNLNNLRLCRLETRRSLLKLLSDMGINAEIVRPSKPNPFRIVLTLKKIDTVTAMALLHKSALAVRKISVIADLTAVVVVASAVTAEQETMAMTALKQQQIPVTALVRQARRLTILVPAPLALGAAHILHKQLTGSKLVA